MGVRRGVGVYATLLGALVGGSLFLAAPAFAALEMPITEAPTAIAGTSAVLHGTLNPNASAAAGYYFSYGGGSSCEGPTTPLEPEQTGKAIKVSTPLIGLEGSTEYSFCVVATHTEGEVTESVAGAPVTFTTLPSKPAAQNGELLGLTPFSAFLYSLVDPENQSTTCSFEYGETMAFGESVPCEPENLAGAGLQAVFRTFTGLKPGTTYFYRVAATNATGETKGPTGEFSTQPLVVPSIDSENAANVTPSGASLEGLVNPNYQETTYKFEYATNKELTGATTVAGTGPLPAEFADQFVSTPLTGLSARTTYYYRVVATNETGTAEGPIQSFTTQGVPIVTTGGAQQISRTVAIVGGTVDPGGAPTSAHVAYVDQAGYEAVGGAGASNPYADGFTTPSAAVGADSTAHSIEVQLRELKPETTYHYAVVGTSSLGTTVGPDMTFTTAPSTPPVAVTGEATQVTQSSATLSGSVDTHGLGTDMGFELSKSPNLGFLEAASIVPGSESGTAVSITLSTGPYLPAGTTFYYRARASNADGVSYGAVKTFTTASPPALPSLSSPPLLVLPKTPATPTQPLPKMKPLSSAQKLAKALKACAKRPKSKRAACRRQAHKRYGKKK